MTEEEQTTQGGCPESLGKGQKYPSFLQKYPSYLQKYPSCLQKHPSYLCTFQCCSGNVPVGTEGGTSPGAAASLQHSSHTCLPLESTSHRTGHKLPREEQQSHQPLPMDGKHPINFHNQQLPDCSGRKRGKKVISKNGNFPPPPSLQSGKMQLNSSMIFFLINSCGPYYPRQSALK